MGGRCGRWRRGLLRFKVRLDAFQVFLHVSGLTQGPGSHLGRTVRLQFGLELRRFQNQLAEFLERLGVGCFRAERVRRLDANLDHRRARDFLHGVRPHSGNLLAGDRHPHEYAEEQWLHVP